MDDATRWIRLDGAVNARDLGGLPTTDGRTTRRARILRSDNLQDLSIADLRLLLDDYALKNIIDLRSNAEVHLEGPGPLSRIPSIRIHQLSLFPEGGQRTDVAADTPGPIDVDKILPWQDRAARGLDPDGPAGHYLGYLNNRGDSIVAALRVMARTDGAAIVHCAAGKDRTGVVCALALDVAGVTREAIVADYAQTGERPQAVLDRLSADPPGSWPSVGRRPPEQASRPEPGERREQDAAAGLRRAGDTYARSSPTVSTPGPPTPTCRAPPPWGSSSPAVCAGHAF